MPDPVLRTYLGVPGYVLLWVATLLSLGLFAGRVAYYIRVLRDARPEPRWDQLPKRLKLFAANVLGQRRLLGEPVIGIAHLLIFWAFVFYATSFWWNLIRGLLPVLPVPYADEVGWMALAVGAMGLLGLAALAVAAVRRYLFTPPRLERSRDATLILALIALVLVSSLAGAGFSAMGGARQMVGSLVEGVLRALGAAGPLPGYLWMWWLHMVTVLGFLAYLPYSKHMHLLAAPFSVFFADLGSSRAPAASEGASRREEFTWRELFSGLACAECGRCDRACPALTSGSSLSPKELMHELKDLVRRRGPDGNGLLGGKIKSEHVWACATCAACMERCPSFNEHLPVLIELRRHLVARGEIDQRLQAALMNLSRYGNSFGQSPRGRAKWTHGLGFRIKDARKEAVEYLWFTGDHAAYDPRGQAVSAATARVFERVGLSYGILYEGEQNSGNDVRRAGEEGLFETLRDKNLAAFSKARFERIVTGDPHSYHALKNEYGRSNGVLHVSELLSELIDSGRLPIRTPIGQEVTYQDPCYLARYNAVHEPPRRVLLSLGATLVEMPGNRADTWCCGAGGGRIWMEDVPGVAERPSDRRVREAAHLDGVRTVVVTCPKDLVMFEDAVKTTGLEQQLQVKDLVQLVDQATRPPEAATHG